METYYTIEYKNKRQDSTGYWLIYADYFNSVNDVNSFISKIEKEVTDRRDFRIVEVKIQRTVIHGN